MLVTYVGNTTEVHPHLASSGFLEVPIPSKKKIKKKKNKVQEFQEGSGWFRRVGGF